jgi:hypothetical protein
MAVKVACRYETLQRDGDRLVETAELGGAEHGALRLKGWLGKSPLSAADRRQFAALVTRLCTDGKHKSPRRHPDL